MTGFLTYFVMLLFRALTLAVLVRVFLTWFPISPYNRFVQILYQITEPILRPFRRIIPPIGMVDISPIVALLVLQLLEQIVMRLIYSVV
jgi:YggT family protein